MRTAPLSGFWGFGLHTPHPQRLRGKREAATVIEDLQMRYPTKRGCSLERCPLNTSETSQLLTVRRARLTIAAT